MQFHILHKSYKSRIRELRQGGVRGLGVRGLGLKQKEERLITEAKIISYLSVSPFTYEQLQKISKIHRNILKLRLDQFSSKGIIIKHRYYIPYKLEYYGYMYRHPIKYRPPLFNHIYYLLNLSKTKQIKDLVSRYLIRNEEEWEEDYKTGRIEIQNQPLFSFPLSVLEQSLLSSAKRISNKQYFSPSEEKENYRKSAEIVINLFRQAREWDLSAIKNRTYIQGYRLREKDSKQLKEIVNFFTNKGFSLEDVLVRCSTEHTLIEGDRYYLGGSTGPLSLPMTHYSVLWHAVEKHGFFKKSKGVGNKL